MTDLDGEELDGVVNEAATLIATVLGQDREEAEDGAFRIARRVAKDQVISVADLESRHGHKTAARGFDGYKGHVAIDPDSEIVAGTVVTAGNAGAGARSTRTSPSLPPQTTWRASPISTCTPTT